MHAVMLNLKTVRIEREQDTLDVAVVFTAFDAEAASEIELHQKIENVNSLDDAVDRARAQVLAFAQGLAEAAKQPFFRDQ